MKLAIQKTFRQNELPFIHSKVKNELYYSHWGKRFKYTYRVPDYEHIYESIESVDREGMDFIEKKDLDGFHDYLGKTKNTICGRNPICLLLALINHAESKGQEKCLKLFKKC